MDISRGDYAEYLDGNGERWPIIVLSRSMFFAQVVIIREDGTEEAAGIPITHIVKRFANEEA